MRDLNRQIFIGHLMANTGDANRLASLAFPGIEPNQKRNATKAPLISADAGHAKVRVIGIDENLMIARSVTSVLKLGSIRET